MKKNPLSGQELEELILHYSSEIRKLSYQLENAQTALEDLQKQVKKAPAATEEKPRAAAAVETPVKEKRGKRIKSEKKIKVKAEKEAPKRRGRPRKEKTEAAPMESAPSATVEAPKKKRGRPKKEVTAVKPKTKSKPKSEPKAKPSAKKESKIRTLQDEESKPKGYRLSDWDLFILNTIRKSGKVLVNSELMEKALIRVKKEKLDMDEVALRGKLNRSIHKLSNKRGDLLKVDYPGKGFAYGLIEWADENGKVRDEYTASMN